MNEHTIGKLQRVALREVWLREARDFTQWLQDNIDVLNGVLDLNLVNVDREQSAGAFSVDLVAEDEGGGTVTHCSHAGAWEPDKGFPAWEPDTSALRFRVLYRMIHRTIPKQHADAIMPTIKANDLKTKGVAAIEAALAEEPEAMVSVRGKDRFVVMELSHYHYLRECELEAALAETRADLAAGRYVVETAAEHAKRLNAELGPVQAKGD